MNVSVKIIGLKNLQGKLKAKNFTQPLADGIKKATLLLDREVKQATVVDTGRLRSSVTSKFASGFGQVGTNVQYASSVEYGTPWMAARHMEGGTKVLGKGMFAYAIEKLNAKMKEILGNVANNIEAKWG